MPGQCFISEGLGAATRLAIFALQKIVQDRTVALPVAVTRPAYPNRIRGVWGKMVAEEGLEPPTPGL